MYSKKREISVGGIPNSKEVCMFFALAVLIFNATWSKHCGKVQKYTFKVKKYTFKVPKCTFKIIKGYFQSAKGYFQSTKVYFQFTKTYFRNTKVDFQSTKVYFQSTKWCFQFTQAYFQSTKVHFQFKCKSILAKYKSALSKYKSMLSKYKSILSNYKSILSKYKSALSKYKSMLSKYKSILSNYKATFGTLGTESPESGTFLIPLVPGTRFPEPVPSKPREQNLTRRYPSNTETFRTQPSEPGTLKPQNLSEPIEARIRFPELLPQNRKTCHPEPVPGTRFLPGTAPARQEHTEIYNYGAKTP